MDLAVLILRVVVGLLVAGHGAQKLFGWFGGHGVTGFAGALASMGYRPSRLWAWLGGLAEVGGGVLFALGVFSPLGTLGITASMLTAIAKVHWPKVWATQGGLELPFTNLVVAIAVSIAGPGAYSLDAVLGTGLPSTVAMVLAIVTVVGWLAGVTLSASRGAQQQRGSYK